MSYQMHRIFCATPLEYEEEREAFYDVMSTFNEAEAMKYNILFIPISLVPIMSDKRVHQRVVEENIRSCRYYILLLNDGWGPPERNFERDWKLALECAASSDLPMREAVVFHKRHTRAESNHESIADLRNSDGSNAGEFIDVEDFKKQLSELLSRWLATVVSPPATAAGAAV